MAREHAALGPEVQSNAPMAVAHAVPVHAEQPYAAAAAAAVPVAIVAGVLVESPPPQQQQQQQQAEGSDVASQLTQLHALKVSGALSEAEFNAAKANVLSM